MFYNYLKTGWRSFRKGGLYSMINLIGLSLGTTVVILLALFIKDEWTFESFHDHPERIYRVWVKEHVEGDIFFNTVTPFIIGPQLKEHLPEISAMTRYVSSNPPVRLGDYSSSDVIYLADPEFVEIFDFPLISGDGQSFKTNPTSILMSAKCAKKYFANEDPIGQTLEIQMDGVWTPYKVTGVTGDPPSNTGLQFDIIMPMKNADRLYDSRVQTSWTNVYVETFVKLNDQNDVLALQVKVAPFIDSQVKDIYAPGEYEVGFQPLTDIHLNNQFPAGILPVSDGRYPYILAMVAILILILAGINFTTLAIGRSLKRAKEVGIRKTAGASRWQLMFQFWSEAIIASGVSVLVGLGLASLMLPKFNTLADKILQIDFSISNLIFLVVMILLIGFISGIYPSLILSKINPVQSLRGSITSSQIPKHLILKSLVGFQFTLSVILICCALVMQKQIHFLQNSNLGFDKDQVIAIPYSKPGSKLTDVIKEARQTGQRIENELRLAGDQVDLTISSHVFGTQGWSTLGYNDQNLQSYRNFRMNGVDENFLPMFKIKLDSGRNFQRDNQADKRSVIVNTAFAKEFNVAINDNLPNPFQEFRVIGVTEDFNFQSLHQAVDPLILCTDPIAMIQMAPDVSFLDFPDPKLSLKLTDNIVESLNKIEQVWKSTTELPYEFSFITDNIDRQYRSEQKLGAVISTATILAIVIAALGLFGIITLMIARKSKEIAIRKVLGANTFNIVLYFNRKFTLMIAIACILAIPLSLIIMRKWLEDFAYRIHPNWWIFAIAATIALLVATITISFQSIRAAISNPIKSIQAE
ncbi:MAG: ABC transporter permease [Saprospiraceae bacterium]|nr:ABC transporter permease [Saprospiraceae bacterium]